MNYLHVLYWQAFMPIFAFKNWFKTFIQIHINLQTLIWDWLKVYDLHFSHSFSASFNEATNLDQITASFGCSCDF